MRQFGPVEKQALFVNELSWTKTWLFIAIVAPAHPEGSFMVHTPGLDTKASGRRFEKVWSTGTKRVRPSFLFSHFMDEVEVQ